MKKEIYLKQLILKNFKGITSLQIDFTENKTVIAGGNSTGKTTIQDAFTWLLFGKDSTGRADHNFNIKTLDEKGKPILKLEHEVAAVLVVDGVETSLQRTYLEKWDKPRGTSEETLKNHYTEYLINGVKIATKREYDAEISSIIPEDVFKMITSPFYFTSLPAASQKAMLFDMAGNVSDQEIADLKPEYLELLSQLTGRSLEVFKKEIAAKKKAIKDELDQIPARLDTANTLMPEAENWEELDKEMAEKKAKLKEITDQIADKSKLVEAEYKRKSEIQRQIGEKKLERSKMENAIRVSAADIGSAARSVITELEVKIQNYTSDVMRKQSFIDSVVDKINTINTELDTLRGQYRAINAEQLEYPEGAFACPTCNRPLDPEDLEEKQKELQANFNQSKSRRLLANKDNGSKRAELLKQLQASKETTLAEIAEIERQLDILKGQKQFQEENMPSAISADVAVSDNEDIIRLGNEISELENQLNMEATSVDTDDLKDGKAIIEESIQELNKRLAKREIIERTQKLIRELESSKMTNNQALADLERMEFIAIDFQKAKDNELMNRINGMFSIVSFNFVDEQLNGGEKITCVCTVNGIPYPDVNNAGRINAGLDIISAICRIKGVTAPIFIDNAEAVNNILETESQQIQLRVSDHQKLMIRISGNEPMETYQEL